MCPEGPEDVVSRISPITLYLVRSGPSNCYLLVTTQGGLVVGRKKPLSLLPTLGGYNGN